MRHEALAVYGDKHITYYIQSKRNSSNIPALV